MIVDFNDFIGEIRIPNLFAELGTEDAVNLAIQEEFQIFIDKYEPIYMLQFFGDEETITNLYNYYKLPDEEKTDEVKNELLKSLKSIIPNFIAFYWFRNETIQNTGIGAVIPQGQNSKRINNVDRCVFIWNEMVEKSRLLYRDYWNVSDKRETYSGGNGFFPYEDIFNKINSFGI